jgi:hypothetical protein
MRTAIFVGLCFIAVAICPEVAEQHPFTFCTIVVMSLIFDTALFIKKLTK